MYSKSILDLNCSVCLHSCDDLISFSNLWLHCSVGYNNHFSLSFEPKLHSVILGEISDGLVCLLWQLSSNLLREPFGPETYSAQKSFTLKILLHAGNNKFKETRTMS